MGKPSKAKPKPAPKAESKAKKEEPLKAPPRGAKEEPQPQAAPGPPPAEEPEQPIPPRKEESEQLALTTEEGPLGSTVQPELEQPTPMTREEPPCDAEQPEWPEAPTSRFDEQLLKTVAALEALQQRVDDRSKAALAEHEKLQEQLRSTEVEVQRAATSAEDRRNKLREMHRDCEQLQERLQAARKFVSEAFNNEDKAEQSPRTAKAKSEGQLLVPAKVQDVLPATTAAPATNTLTGEEFLEAQEAFSETEVPERLQDTEEEQDAEEGSEEELGPREGGPQGKQGWFGGWFKNK